MNKKKAISTIGIFTLVFALLGFFIFLPAINIKSESFWVFSAAVVGFVIIISSVFFSVLEGDFVNMLKNIVPVLALLVIVFFIGKAISSPILRAKKYSKMISDDIVEREFKDYSATIETVPLLDKDSAMKIANRKLGGLQDVISQFEINDTEQITVKGEPARVASLNHAGFIKWFTNMKTGTPGFIKVDMNTQEADLVRVDGGMKYTKSDYLFRNIERYMRVKYPTKMFSEITLELDENEHPYWLAAIMDKKIGLFGGEDVKGAVLVNAVTGEHKQYSLDKIPKWVDNVYDSDLLLEQYDNYGTYQKGFINSLIGQKGVKKTTQGYNYIPQGDDNWIYTGITSVGKDESNIAFVLMNKRTKESQVYPISGAEEFSAMASAEGAVQHLGYKSTFPLLLKIENQPTYLVSLKDSGGLVKMYGMINVEKYQIVATGTSIIKTLSEYKKLLKDGGADTSSSEAEEISGTIEDIRGATIDGNSIYFLKLKDKTSYYLLNIADNNRVSILSVGDKIKLEAEESEDDIIPAILK